ncbi:Hypothetical Protein FCC1311_048122 [Hondaea fermentalgiana]|uniref:Uncharacterized protein n=1 Tax=Hondaea fermentalgiana TaxID=2315210 RepID=A0A2R5GJY5_9STRA|nr:Hypothetical Protein FCC1311_048122 [Hondaea fermentalgiana]|eukprot:GBG28591.1 Hypothetical Protein FCC1311_048122 [Hondaea fermentalgiana]
MLPSSIKLAPALVADENRRDPVGARLIHAIKLDEHLVPEDSLLVEVNGRDVRNLPTASLMEQITSAQGKHLDLCWLRPKASVRRPRSKSSDSTTRRRRRSFGLSNNLKTIWSGLEGLVQALDNGDDLASLLKLPLTGQSEVVQPQDLDQDHEDAAKRARVEDISGLLEVLASQVRRRNRDAVATANDLRRAKEDNSRLAQRVDAQRELIQQLESGESISSTSNEFALGVSSSEKDKEKVNEQEERKDGTLLEETQRGQAFSAEVAAVERKLAQVTQDLRTATAAKQFFERKVQVMERSLEATEGKLVDLSRANEEFKTQLSQQESRVKEQQSLITNLEAQHKATLNEHLDRVNVEHSRQLKEMVASLEASHDEKTRSATAREETLRAHLDLLQQSVATKDREVGDLKVALQQARARLAQHQDDQRALSRERNDANSEELKLWRRDANQLRKTVEELSLQLRKADQEVVLYKQKFTSAEHELEKAHEALVDVASRQHAASSERVADRKERDALMSRLQEAERRAARSNTDSAQVRMEMEELRHLQAAQLAELEAKYRHNAHDVTAHPASEKKTPRQEDQGWVFECDAMLREDLCAQLLRAQVLAQDRQETCTMLREQVQIVSDELARRADELESLRSQAASEASSKFQAVLSKVESDFEHELKTLHTNLAEKEAALTELRDVLRTKHEELGRLRERHSQALAQVAQERNDWKEELAGVRETASLEQSRASELAVRLDEALRSKEASDTGLHEAQRKVQELLLASSKLEDARVELESLRGAHAKLQDVETKLAQAEADRASSAAESEAARVRAAQAEKDADAARRQLEEAEGLRSGLQRAQSEQQSFTHQIQADLNEQRRVCTRMRRELADAEQALRASRGALDAQEAKERQTRDMINRLVEQLDAAQSEARSGKLAISEHETVVRGLESDIAALHTEVNRLKNGLQDKAHALAHAEQAREHAETSAARALETLEAKVEARDDQLEALEKDLTDSRHALDVAEHARDSYMRARAGDIGSLSRATGRLQMQQRHCREQSVAILENFASELAAALASCARRAQDLEARHLRRVAGLEAALQDAEHRLNAQQQSFNNLSQERQEELIMLREKTAQSKESERAARRELAMAKTALASQKEELRMADERAKASTEMAGRLQTRVEELDDALEEERTTAQRNTIRLECELTRLRDSHEIEDGARRALAQAREDAEEREARLRDLEVEASTLREEKKSLQQRLADARDSTLSAERELEVVQEKLNSEVDQLAEAASAKVALETRLKDAHAHEKQCKLQSDAQIARLQGQVARLRQALEDEQAAASVAASSHHKSDRLEEECERLRTECERLRDALAKSHDLVAAVQARLEEHEDQVEETKRDSLNCQQELHRSLRESENRAAGLASQLQIVKGESEAAQHSLKERIVSLEAETFRLTSEKEDLIAVHDDERFAMTQERDAFRKERSELTSAAEAQGQRLTRLEARCNELEEEAAGYQSSRFESEQTARGAAKEIDILRDQCRLLEDKVTSAEQESLRSSELEDLLKRQQTESARWRKEKEDAQEQYQRQLEDFRASQLSQLEDLRAARQSEQVRYEEVQTKLETMRAELASALEGKSSLEIQVESLQHAVQAGTESQRVSVAEKLALESRCEDLQSKVSACHAQLETAHRESQFSAAERADLSEALESSRHRIAQLEEQFSHLQRQANENALKLSEEADLSARLSSAQKMLQQATEREAELLSELEVYRARSFEEKEQTEALDAEAREFCDVATQASLQDEPPSSEKATSSDAVTQTLQQASSVEKETVSGGCQTDDLDLVAPEELKRMRELHKQELADFLARVQEEIVEERERQELEQLVHRAQIDKDRAHLEGLVARQAEELDVLRAEKQQWRSQTAGRVRNQAQQTDAAAQQAEMGAATPVSDAVVSEYDRLLLYEENPDLNETLSELETTKAVLEASNSQLASFRARETETMFQTELLKSALESAQSRIRALENRRGASLQQELSTSSSSPSQASSRREDELHEEVIIWRSVAERDAKRCAALMDAVARESDRASRLEEALARRERHGGQYASIASSSASLTLSESGVSVAESATLHDELETLASDMNETLQALGSSGVSNRMVSSSRRHNGRTTTSSARSISVGRGGAYQHWR